MASDYRHDVMSPLFLSPFLPNVPVGREPLNQETKQKLPYLRSFCLVTAMRRAIGGIGAALNSLGNVSRLHSVLLTEIPEGVSGLSLDRTLARREEQEGRVCKQVLANPNRRGHKQPSSGILFRNRCLGN